MKGTEKRMQLLNNYFIMEDAVPERYCDYILQYGQKLKEQEAKIGWSGNLPKEEVEKIRHSKVVWLDERWIYREIQPYVNQANANAGWNFQWDYSESCQFTKYTKGQFYDWHCDGWDKPYMYEGNDPSNGKIRKLSVTVTLSDPKEYSGGELEFDFRNMDPDKKPNIRKCTEILPKGSLVVFPGFVWHRVCPVKKGTRHSLVIWNLGWPYK